MTVQEIFDTPAIKKIEMEMIYLEADLEKSCWRKSGGVEMMRTLLDIRRDLLADMFVMDEHYKKLLSNFNEAMKLQLIRMRLETIKAAQGIVDAGVAGNVQAVGKCSWVIAIPNFIPCKPSGQSRYGIYSMGQLPVILGFTTMGYWMAAIHTTAIRNLNLKPRCSICRRIQITGMRGWTGN